MSYTQTAILDIEIKNKLESGAQKNFAPDYLAFTTYAYMVLMFCHLNKPDAEKVDFIIERNGEITDHIKDFYKGMPISLEYAGCPELIPLLGDLIPAGKERIPLQAADVLCWHTRRFHEGTLDAEGIKRYENIATRIGPSFDYAPDHIDELWTALHTEENL